jgi:hypothetical protein
MSTTAAHELPMCASVRRARRVAVARALAGLTLDWADIDAAPPWLALPDDGARERLCASTGAWWLMASLKACIDGKRLAKVRDLLGDEFLTRLREPTDAQHLERLNQARRSLLPPAEDLPAHLLACGRALLSWSLRPQLRAPVLRDFGWSVDERHYKIFDVHAGWARHALEAAARQANSPAARDGEPETAE